MPVARTTEELEQQILQEMQSAMSEVNDQAKEDMQKGTEYFYNGGKPKMYVRTGALGETPKTTPAVTSGSSVSFEAYLDKGYVYNSGDSPSMGQVLDLANYGSAWMTSSGAWAHPTVGAKGFWEKSEQWISESLDKIMGQHFPG